MGSVEHIALGQEKILVANNIVWINAFTCFQRVALEPDFFVLGSILPLGDTKSRGFESNKGFLLDGDKVTIYWGKQK